jgi:hypothetical protein
MWIYAILYVVSAILTLFLKLPSEQEDALAETLGLAQADGENA